MSRPIPVRRGLALLTATTLVVGVGAVAPTSVVAATPCLMTVKKSLKKTNTLAAQATLKRYVARVDDPKSTKYDQKARIMVTTYPVGAYPQVIAAPLGTRLTTGALTKARTPKAIGAVNGDFHTEPTIRGKTFRLSRGPMVVAKQFLRGSHKKQRVVGVDRKLRPYAGELALRGRVTLPSGPVTLQGVNWHTIRSRGVTVYTPDWNASTATPRPAGEAELVLDALNVVTQIRTSTKNASSLGAPVAAGTRVVAFPADTVAAASGVKVGTAVKVRIKQRTDTGVTLVSAVGRGLPLVENGVAAPLGCAAYDHSKAARPRTFIGWTKQGVWRSVTVPGTEFVGAGLRIGGFGLAHSGNLARSFGLVNAYELDGGGSTTLWTRKRSSWSRKDLWQVTGGTYERTVPNAVAFVLPEG